MGIALFEIAVLLIAAWFILRLIGRTARPASPAEPEPGDYAQVSARLRPRPKSGAGAVALAEPEEDEFQSFPSR